MKYLSYEENLRNQVRYSKRLGKREPYNDAKTIVICGSMRFYEKMFEEQVRLSKEGNIVILPIIELVNNEPNLTKEEKDLYSEIHMRKIDIADEIYVVNYDGYVDPSTAREITYASQIGVHVKFMES